MKQEWNDASLETIDEDGTDDDDVLTCNLLPLMLQNINQH